MPDFSNPRVNPPTPQNRSIAVTLFDRLARVALDLLPDALRPISTPSRLPFAHANGPFLIRVQRTRPTPVYTPILQL